MKRVSNWIVMLAILLVGMAMGAVLALYVAEQYLLSQPLVRERDEVDSSAFCQGGLEPQPEFCN